MIRTRELIRQVHLWIGLLLCIPLVLIGLTGSILVFEDELHAAFTPRVQPGEPHPVSEIIAAARAAAPDAMVPSSYMASAAPGLPVTVRLSPPGRQSSPAEALRVDVDPVTLAAVANPSEGFLRQVFYLHSTLLMKTREGRQMAGWFGVAMLVLAVSGLVNWWPRRGKWRTAFTVSPTAQGYRLWRELHGMAGIWGFAVLAIVSFSGVYLAFPETIRAMVDPVLPARDLRAAMAAVKVQPVKGAAPLGVDDAVAMARVHVPESELTAIFLPARPDQPYRIALFRDGQERGETPVTVLVDPWVRQIAEIFDPRGFSAGEAALAAQHALHAGRGFGLLWKLLVFLSGMLPALFAATGIAMWLKRRRSVARVIPLIDQSQTARRAGE
jgi:uncharacterized iron-regulated membrane protein